jgi:hypothetical protein
MLCVSPRLYRCSSKLKPCRTELSLVQGRQCYEDEETKKRTGRALVDAGPRVGELKTSRGHLP